MKTPAVLLALLLTLCFNVVQGAEPPLKVDIVPETRNENGAFVSAGKKSRRPFYVIVTNLTKTPQPVFVTAYSWGYQTISFIMTLADGTTGHITVKPQVFTKNHPSTYIIPPGGHQVYPIVLDDTWEGYPNLETGFIPVKLQAVYEVKATNESGEQKVWVGRVASQEISLSVNHR